MRYIESRSDQLNNNLEAMTIHDIRQTQTDYLVQSWGSFNNKPKSMLEHNLID